MSSSEALPTRALSCRSLFLTWTPRAFNRKSYSFTNIHSASVWPSQKRNGSLNSSTDIPSNACFWNLLAAAPAGLACLLSHRSIHQCVVSYGASDRGWTRFSTIHDQVIRQPRLHKLPCPTAIKHAWWLFISGRESKLSIEPLLACNSLSCDLKSLYLQDLVLSAFPAVYLTCPTPQCIATLQTSVYIPYR